MCGDQGRGRQDSGPKDVKPQGLTPVTRSPHKRHSRRVHRSPSRRGSKERGRVAHCRRLRNEAGAGVQGRSGLQKQGLKATPGGPGNAFCRQSRDHVPRGRRAAQDTSAAGRSLSAALEAAKRVAPRQAGHGRPARGPSAPRCSGNPPWRGCSCVPCRSGIPLPVYTRQDGSSHTDRQTHEPRVRPPHLVKGARKEPRGEGIKTPRSGHHASPPTGKVHKARTKCPEPHVSPCAISGS